MPRVFISYRKSDSLEITGRLADALRARLGTDAVFWDERSIGGGDVWPERLRQGVTECDVLLAVIGCGWLSAVDEYSLRRIDQPGDWVRLEIETALTLNKRVIPVLVRGAKPLTKAAKLAPCIEPLCDLQAICLESGAAFDYGFAQILELLPDGAMQAAPTSTREQELRYLARLIREEEAKAELYSALHGVEAKQPRRTLRRRAADEADMALLKLRSSHRANPERITMQDYEDILTAFEGIQRAALLGAPGAGKSTTLRKLAINLARAAEADREQPVPLLVFLSNWTGEESLAQFLAAQAPEIGGAAAELSRANRLVLLLDGLNEMPTPQRRAKVADAARFCATLQPHTKVVVSCRLQDYTPEMDLGWDTLTLEPLTKPKVWAVLRHWLAEEPDGEATADRLFWQLAGDERLAGAWEALRAAGLEEEAFWAGPGNSKFDWEFAGTAGWAEYELWRAHLSDPRSLLALASNPFLLYMLFWVWEEEGQLPQNRGDLFRCFVDRLLGRESLYVKEERTGEWRRTSEGDRLVAGLTELAWRMQRVRVDAGKDTSGDFGVLTVAGRATVLECLGGEMLLKKALDGTLLEGEGEIRFRHQLLQEYFTALALQGRMATMAAAELWPRDRWWERSGWEEAAVLLAGLYEDNTPVIRWLAGAQPEVAADCLLKSGAKPADSNALLGELQAAWLPRLTDLKTDPQPEARAAIGRALGRLGLDNRKGVGVKDGIPDIDWVKVEKFCMSRYLVTNAQYEAFVEAEDGYKDDRWWEGLTNPDRDGENPQWRESNHPRETVSWWEAMAFCGWLSHKLGYEVRLPKEEEWERAAFGNGKRKYPWGKEYKTGYANVRETHYLGRTSAVGMYPQGASPEGVMDLAGNVWEWCLNEREKPERTQRSGTEPRVLRGGSWLNLHDNLAVRYDYHPNFRYYSRLGFRLVCSAPIHAGH